MKNDCHAYGRLSHDLADFVGLVFVIVRIWWVRKKIIGKSAGTVDDSDGIGWSHIDRQILNRYKSNLLKHETQYRASDRPPPYKLYMK